MVEAVSVGVEPQAKPAATVNLCYECDHLVRGDEPRSARCSALPHAATLKLARAECLGRLWVEKVFVPYPFGDDEDASETSIARVIELETKVAALEAALKADREIIAEANNSLFGSQSYFVSADAGKYHLARPIEALKEHARLAGRPSHRPTET